MQGLGECDTVDVDVDGCALVDPGELECGPLDLDVRAGDISEELDDVLELDVPEVQFCDSPAKQPRRAGVGRQFRRQRAREQRGNEQGPFDVITHFSENNKTPSRSQHFADQSLEILRFEDRRQYRMVVRLPQTSDKLHLAAGVETSPRNRFRKLLNVDATRTRKCD